MPYPVSSEKNGIKIIPELMEPEKMYYCIHDQKVMLVYKDAQQFLNCYEIEEKELIDVIRECQNPDQIEAVIQNYLKKHQSET